MSIAKKMVAANLPKKVSEVIEKCRVVVKKMTGNAYFPSPAPTLAVFIADIDALEEAVVNVKFFLDGVSIKNAALDAVISDMRRLVNYVQLIADADPDNAEVIINSSGFHVKRISLGNSKKGYKVESLETGRVILNAPANNHQYPYIWEVSTSRRDWSFLMVSRTSTAQCETLTSRRVYYFRYTVVGKDNKLSPPSAAVVCLVK